MDGRTDGRTHARTDSRMDGRTDERTNERTDGRTDGRTDRQIYCIIIIVILFLILLLLIKEIYFLINTIKIEQKSIAHEKRRRVNVRKSIKVYCSLKPLIGAGSHLLFTLFKRSSKNEILFPHWIATDIRWKRSLFHVMMHWIIDSKFS